MPEPTNGTQRAIETMTGARHLSSSAAHYPDPTMDALAVIGADLTQPLRPANAEVERDLDPVDATTASSGWLAWRTRLPGRWMDRVSLPMLVRRSTGDAEPAAVLPQRGGAVIVSGKERSESRLDSGTAAGLADEAVVFARDVPAGSRPWDMVRWALAGERRETLLFVTLAALGGLASLFLPLATSAIFSTAIPGGDLQLTIVLLIAFAVASTGAAVIALARGYLLVRIRDRMDLVLAPAVMARLIRLRVPFFRDRSVGDIVNRATSIEAARAQVGDAVVATIVMSAFGLISLVYLFMSDVAVGVITTIAAFLVLGASLLVQWRARRTLPELLEARSGTDALLLSLLSGLISWRVTASEDRALAEWSDRQRSSTDAMRQRISAIALGPVLDAAGPIAVLTIFTIAVVLVPSPALRPESSTAPGAFLAMYAAVIQVTIALLALSANLLSLSEYGPLLRRVAPIADAATEGAEHGQHPGRLSGSVALRSISFGYQSVHSPLFRDLSFTIEPGEFVALVGPSGSGKSTLLRLMLGFEEPWNGSVLYDGHDLQTLDVTAVRRQLGVVLQGGRPLGRTVRESLCGSRQLSDARLWSILQSAGLADDIREVPGGLDADLGEQAMSLSGGQRQRLLIGAALSMDPAILLFDEATSALDNISQSVVMDTVLSLPVTRIVIAHRLSTIERADRVLVISNGELVEQGPPADLIAAGGLFAQLAARQELT